MTEQSGRPLKFKTPEELEARINEYFTHCDNGEEVTELSKRGELMTYVKPIPYTVEGLALWLDVAAVTIRRYGQRDEFCTIISRAREKIFHSWIKNGLSGRFNPKIVALCLAANYKPYNIKQETEHIITIEDRLRQIHRQRREGLPLPDPDTMDAEVVSNYNEN